MTTFEGTRAGIRRSTEAVGGISARLRAGAEQQAEMMRRAEAQRERQLETAQAKINGAIAETADVQARSLVTSAEAQARAQAAIGDLMNTLGAAFVATTQKVMDANADANMAEHKLDIQRQARRAVAAADQGAPLPADVYHIAAKDAYAERAATLQAHKDASAFAQTLAEVEDPQGIYDLVHKRLAMNVEGMSDPAYREYYANAFRTLADDMAAKREASLIQERRVEAYQNTIASVVLDAASAKDPQRLEEIIVSGRLASPEGFRKGFDKDAVTAILKNAEETGTLHKVVPMLGQTTLLDRYPVLMQTVAGAIYRENKALQKQRIDTAATEVESMMSRVLNDPAASVEDLDSLASAMGQAAHTLKEGGMTVESGRSLYKRISAEFPKIVQKREKAIRFQQWVTYGGAFDDEFKPYINRLIDEARTENDFGRVQRLMVDTGYIPQILVDNVNSVFKGRDGTIDPSQLANTLPVVTSILAANQQRNGALLYGLEDRKTAYLLQAIQDRVSEGVGVDAALSWVVGQYPPDVLDRIAAFDVDKALASKNYKDVDSVEKQVFNAATPGFLKDFLGGLGFDFESLEGLDPGSMASDVRRRVAFLSRGIDDGHLNDYVDQAVNDVLQQYASQSVAVPSRDGSKLLHLPNAAMRRDITTGITLRGGRKVDAAKLLDMNFTILSSVMQDPEFAAAIPEFSDFGAGQMYAEGAFRPSVARYDEQPDGSFSTRQVYKLRVGLRDVPAYWGFGWSIGDDALASRINQRLAEEGSTLAFERDENTGFNVLTFTWDRKKLAADAEQAEKFMQDVEALARSLGARYGEAAANDLMTTANQIGPFGGKTPQEIQDMILNNPALTPAYRGFNGPNLED